MPKRHARQSVGARNPRQSNEKSGFSAGEAAALAGLKYATLAYWDRSGFLRPSVATARGAGKGRGRIYSFRDLVALRTAHELRKQGISLQSIRAVVKYLQGHGMESPLAEAKLIVPPKSREVFVVRDPERLWSALREPGQGVMRMVVEIGMVEQELRRHLSKDSRATETREARRSVA